MFCPPRKDAFLDTGLLFIQLGVLIHRTIGALLAHRLIGREKAQAAYWRQRFDRTDDPMMMLRASEVPGNSAQTLLRGTFAASDTPPEQLLRASKREE